MRSGATTFPPFLPPAPSWPGAAFTEPDSAWGFLQASGWRISLRSPPSTTGQTASSTFRGTCRKRQWAAKWRPSVWQNRSAGWWTLPMATRLSLIHIWPLHGRQLPAGVSGNPGNDKAILLGRMFHGPVSYTHLSLFPTCSPDRYMNDCGGNSMLNSLSSFGGSYCITFPNW